MSQLQSDLRNCFGFSRENAAKAERLWRAKQLSDEFAEIMERLFLVPRTAMNPMKPRIEPTVKFNKLNYKLSMGELDA